MTMTRMKRKIKDRSGASLSVALLFFLVCAIVGSILIAAASVAIGRMKNIDQGEQDRYACDSAMNLIAEKMERGEITFEAKMPNKVLVQTDDNYETGALTDLSQWKLSKLSDLPTSSSGFQKLKENVSFSIFQHYAVPDESAGNKVLGDWYLTSAGNKTDSDLEEFFYGTPDSTYWTDSKRVPINDYMYITDDGTTDIAPIPKPIALKINQGSTTKDVFSVNVLFCMDAQFNITAVVYPQTTSDLKNARLYRVVMIPCKETSVTFDPGITQEEKTKTETIHNDDGSTSTEEVTYTETSVRHKMTVKVAWGDAVKTSVLPPNQTNNDISVTGDYSSEKANATAKSNEYPDFFPERFRKVLLS